jgi:hypothetical protein
MIRPRPSSFLQSNSMSDMEPDEVRLHQERLLDEALEATFPASDPIAVPRAGLATVSKRCSRARLHEGSATKS